MINLPECRWRGSVTIAGHHICTSPKLRHGPNGVEDKLCLDCYLRDHPPDPKDIQVSKQPVKRNQCQHLGEPTGERILCNSCAGHVEVKLMSCQLHGDCTTHKYINGKFCCANCPDFVEKLT